jgi:transposase
MAEKTILPILKEVYPYLYGRIISYVILRNIRPLPIKSMRYLYEKTYLSRISDESMSPGSISGMLSSLPEDQSIRVMWRLTEKGEYVLMDSRQYSPGLRTCPSWINRRCYSHGQCDRHGRRGEMCHCCRQGLILRR